MSASVSVVLPVGELVVPAMLVCESASELVLCMGVSAVSVGLAGVSASG